MAHSVRRRAVRLGCLLLLVAPITASAQSDSGSSEVPRTPWGAPDLQGVWDFRSLTPIERPDDLGDKEILTSEEAAQFVESFPERRLAALAAIGPPDVVAELWVGPDSIGDGLSDRRTALIREPRDGKLPLSDVGRATRGIIVGRFRDRALGPEDRGLSERCIMWTSTPILNGPSNNNLQIFQTPDYVVVYHEMIHDVRIIPLDGRPLIASTIQQLRGDSRGYWEGDTLVVETQRFNQDSRSSFPPVPFSAQMRLVERFTREDDSTLRYAYTVDDPVNYAAPWSLELPMQRSDQRPYEYACHEGNRSMTVLLEGARAEETAETVAR